MPLTIKHWLTTCKARWHQSAEHERTLVLLLIAALLIIILWISIWAPQCQALRQAEQAHNDELALQATISQLPNDRTSTSTPALTEETLSGLLTRSSSDAQLNLERMDRDAAGQINLSLNGSLDNFMPWLEQLSQRGVTVRTLLITVNPDQQLTVQLTLQAI